MHAFHIASTLATWHSYLCLAKGGSTLSTVFRLWKPLKLTQGNMYMWHPKVPCSARLAGIAVPSFTTSKYTSLNHSQDQSSISIWQSLWASWIDGLQKVIEAASTKTSNHIVCLHTKCTLVYKTQVKHDDLLCPASHIVCRQCLMVCLQ